MKILEVNNCWGYPNISETIKEFAKANDALILIGTHSLLKLKDPMSKRVKIVIDAIPGLESCGLPVLGYLKVRNRYVRDTIRLGPAKPRKIKVPTNHRRPPTKVFMEILGAKSKTEIIAKIDPKLEYAGMVRSMLSPILPASPHDPTPKKKEKGTVNKVTKAKK